MNNVVELQVSGEKLILRIPRANIIQEIDNIASFDSKTKKLISTGVDQEKFQKNYPRKWGKYKGTLEFLPIFDVRSFNPEAAGLFLWGWLNAMIGQIAGNIIFRSQAKLEINILFDNYETIPLKEQQEFEYLIFRFLLPKKLVVNAAEKQWDKRNNLPIWLLRWVNYIFIVVFILLAVIPISSFITLNSNAQISPLFGFLIFTVGILGTMFIFMYIGNLLSIAAWALCLRLFNSNDILLQTLGYQLNMPVKRKMDKLTSSLVDWILDNKV